ncbi:MAG TPA: hypothetical protein VE439_11315, partial [Anaerolineae bacterium]|nr:hypothetical protein [Anaerolineae bacterium]
VGTPILSIFIGILLLSGPNRHPVVAEMLLRTVLVFNPFYALGSILSGTTPGPFNVSMIAGGPGGPAQPNPLIPDWVYTLIIYSISTCFLLFMASKFIKPVNRWDFTPLGRSAKLSAPSSSDMIE